MDRNRALHLRGLSIRANTAISFSGILVVTGNRRVAVNTPLMTNNGMATRMIRRNHNSGVGVIGFHHHGRSHGRRNRHR